MEWIEWGGGGWGGMDRMGGGGGWGGMDRVRGGDGVKWIE